MNRLLFIPLLVSSLNVSAQVSRLGQDIVYMGETSATISEHDMAPFWLTANRYGLASIAGKSTYLRGALSRDLTADSHLRWRIGYGADFVVYGQEEVRAGQQTLATSKDKASFFIHQLYGQVEYNGCLRLTVGSKEFDSEFANRQLSTGAMSSGFNARPIPQVRIETPGYIPVPLTDHWFGVKVMAAYGWFTDSKWQRKAIDADRLRTANSLYHAKSIYLKLGDEERFPLTLTGGLEFATQFGGEAWNLKKRSDDLSDTDLSHVNMGNGLRSYWNAMFMGGSDPNDGDYKNVDGNHLGSWHGSLNYQGKGWNIRGYFEHFFEDHSQLFWQYGWKDMTWGVEAQLPHNPVVNNIVVEHLSTTDQTGGMYHDATPALPVQISGIDNYYSHHVYGAWQHWGMSIGNPLIISPIYNDRRDLTPQHNRVKAIHIGLAGDPLPCLHYRLLYTNIRSWGTYYKPLTDTVRGQFMMAELAYSPTKLNGWTFTAAAAMNSGKLLRSGSGATLTIRKTGWLTK